MSMQAGLKAGGLGAAIIIVLTLLGLIPIPFLGCLCCLVIFAAMVGAGVMAAKFSPAPRTAGGAAGTGALAGVLSGFSYGLVTGIVGVVRAATGSAANVLNSSLTPDMLQQLQEAGVDPQTFTDTFSFLTSPGGAALGGALCCVGALVLGAVLGAVGGAIGAAMFKDR